MRIGERALENLEWPLVVEELRRFIRTPGGAALCESAPDSRLFARDLEHARCQLLETSEARAVLEREGPAVGNVPEIAAALARSERGGVLDVGELSEVAEVAEALAEARRRLLHAEDIAPVLAARADALPDAGSLARELRGSFDAEGQLRDGVSSVLGDSRASIRRLGSELQRRMNDALQDRDVAQHLSDSFVTVRGGRYVIPVRSEARSHVPGIVHDASSSGTTVFVEPERAVPLNNQLREAELAVQRETRRILRELTDAVGRAAPELRNGLVALAELDLSFARGALSQAWDAVAPEMQDAGTFVLPMLRHPLLARREAVPNDLRLGDSFSTLVLSGPNAGGKSVAMKALALAVLGAHAGLHCCCEAGARIDWTEAVLADIGDAQSLRESLSTFSAHLANLAAICRAADSKTFVALDEVGDGTDPGEGAALAQAVLEALADAGARVVVTTHYNLLKEMADLDPRFENASFEFDPDTLAPTYRLRLGSAGISSATAVAARMGLPQTVLDRANELLEREDRRLEQTLAALNESRVAIEHERREAERLRAETETDREVVRRKLETLQARRDKVHDTLRSELEEAFRGAHEQVAQIIRTLQQKGGGGREVAQAREQLVALEREAARDATLAARTGPRNPLDWRRARPGDSVAVAGGRRGVLEALPDRRGRVAVRVGAARLILSADQVFPVEAVVTASADNPSTRNSATGPGRTRVAAPAPQSATPREIDLRGQRVDGARDRLAEALDRAMLGGRATLRVIHGIGSGALRKALRESLKNSPYVGSFRDAAPEEGGEGVTEVLLKD